MVVVDYDGVLDVDDLPSELAGAVDCSPTAEASTGSIWRAWSASRWRKSSGCSSPKRSSSPAATAKHAAEMLGIGERTLYRKIKEYGL